MMNSGRVAVSPRLGVDDYGVWAIGPTVSQGVKKNAQHIVIGIAGVDHDCQIVGFCDIIHHVWTTALGQAAKAFTAAITVATSAMLMVGPIGRLTTAW